MKVHTHNNLGRYCVEAEIGRGAMGVVYRARDPNIDRVVAIKTISLDGQDPADEAEFRERFLQEARAAGRLSHAGMVTIFDAGEDPATHTPFIVMEFVRGQPLSRVLRDAAGKLDLDTALRYALEIAEALAYAHSQGVVHGDIKPANVLITGDGHPKIADFGVARLSHGLTKPGGKIFGSPAYMAPEQLSGGPADARSDLFSLGVMLYSMLTGFRPFQGNSAETVCFKVMNFEPVPVSSFHAELQPELDSIVSRAIAKEPRKRYQNGAEMAQDIRSFMRTVPEIDDTATLLVKSQKNLSRPEPRTSPVTVSRVLAWQAAAILMLTALLAGGWLLRSDLQEQAVISLPAFSAPRAPEVHKTPSLPPPVHKVKRIVKPMPAPVAAIENVKLRVEILHHFNAGKASLWVDGHLALDQDLVADDQRHPVFRALEMNQVANLALAPGKHSLEVHVVSPENNYDQTEDLQTTLALGPEHVLLVNCDKRKLQVSLQ